MSNEDLDFQILRIRMVEERIAKEYPKGKMRQPVHLSIGQEKPAVAICAAINKEDRMVSTHRSHAHYLAKGGSLKGLIGELYGKHTGCSHGHGGSMHLIDLSVNFHGSTSIVGGTIPVGVGLAFADKIKGDPRKTVVCMGDGAAEQGVFHESLNFAKLHNLNVIFFCENNGYSCYTPLKDRQPKGRAIHDVVRGHGIRARAFVESASYEVIAADIRDTDDAPLFVEVYTHRDFEHCGPGRETPSKPIPATSAWIDKINTEIDEAFKFAEESEDARRIIDCAY